MKLRLKRALSKETKNNSQASIPKDVSMKESKELVVALIAIAGLLAEEFKDGVQAADFADIVAKLATNEELKAKIVAAYTDIEKVPSEIKEVTLVEGLDLLSAVIPEVLKLLASVKK